MYMILRYPTGRLVDAVVLAAHDTQLRVAVPHLNETIELRLREGQWLSDQGSVIAIESIVWDGVTAVPRPLEQRVQAVGSSMC